MRRLLRAVEGGRPLANIRWQYFSKPSDISPVFVVGAPRGGTTLVQRILAVHPDFFSIEGEAGLFTRQNLFAPWRNHFGLERMEVERLLVESRDLTAFFEAGVSAVAERQGCAPEARFVEKTPQHCLHIRRIARLFPWAQFVQVVRDGRDCLVSAREYSAIPRTVGVRRFARYWRSCVRAVSRSDVGQRIHTLRYEDLAGAPETIVRELMAFLGTDSRPDQLDPQKLGADRRSSERMFARLGEPVSPRTVGRHRAALSESERAIFWRVAGAELVQLGYHP